MLNAASVPCGMTTGTAGQIGASHPPEVGVISISLGSIARVAEGLKVVLLVATARVSRKDVVDLKCLLVGRHPAQFATKFCPSSAGVTSPRDV